MNNILILIMSILYMLFAIGYKYYHPIGIKYNF